jgi:CBS domain-containing protein
MLEARRKVLPITDGEGRLLGVVDRADLLRALRVASD